MIYETPKSVLEQRLNEALGTDQEKTIITDLMHLSLLKKAQLNTDDLVYDEMFKLLGLETFSDLISLLDGRTVTFPTRDEFRDTLMTVLCYYYRNVEGKDWAEIRDILGVQDLNAIKEGIRASQFEAFIKKMINKRTIQKKRKRVMIKKKKRRVMIRKKKRRVK